MSFYTNDICKFGVQIVKKWHYQTITQQLQQLGKN
jgi:hypothetical protein